MRNAVIVRSRHSYADTLNLLRKAIADAGNTIFAEIDQAAAAEGAGLALRPTTLLVFGNPRGGTPLMDACPEFAFELPLKILVWEEGRAVSIAYTALKDAAARYGFAGMEERIERIDGVVGSIVNAVD